MFNRRNLAMLLVAVCSLALLPALMPADDLLDPLAPIAPLPSLNISTYDDLSMQQLHQQANDALRALKTATVARQGR
jgi:hypothetical protein